MIRLEKSRMHPLAGRPAAQKRSIPRQRAGLRPPAPSRPAPPRPVFVFVDYPQAGERIVSPDYAIRLSVRCGGAAEVSIDEEAWMPCREAAGYWWHDWSAYGRGPHKICARVTLPDGRRSLSDCRSFTVELP